MKPQQLQAFVAVANCMSIRGAARALGVSPPAITKTMRELERELDAPLLDRSVAGVELTLFGQAFLARARLLLDDMQRARDEIAQLRDGQTGNLRVAVSRHLAETVAAPAFCAFRAKRPSINLRLREATLSRMLAMLEKAQVDFVVSHVDPQEITGDVEAIPLFSVQLVVGLRNQHPLRRHRNLAALIDAEWILPGDEAGERFDSGLFRSQGLHVPQRVMWCDSPVIATELVSQTDMVGLFVFRKDNFLFRRHGIRQINLVKPLPTLQVCVIHHRGKELTPSGKQFVEAIKMVARDMDVDARDD
ncbi:LysR family transcriptional regulator [Pandoraea sp. NPDC087047]|uniref:LysR family transcriptional regulator n=1 Tax=Pandoraea sp. NPDC087047 TaxID=3364390 RepID=UPI0037FEE1E1